VDTSCGRRMTYAEYGETVQALARGLVCGWGEAGRSGCDFLDELVEFCAAYHAATLAGAIPTLLNPTYREREVRHQLGNSGAVLLVTDGTNIEGMNLAGLPNLRRVFCTREQGSGSEPFSDLLKPVSAMLPQPEQGSQETLAALPYFQRYYGVAQGSDADAFQPGGERVSTSGRNASRFNSSDNLLCFLPLYHIYGLNVIANPALILGATLVLMPRFNVGQVAGLLIEEAITTMPLVPPAMNALCQAAEAGQFPKNHKVHWVKSGAAPLAPELPRRFTALTGILVCQGYGMTEASPVTHVGYLEQELYRPDSIGHPLAQTECRVIGTGELGGSCWRRGRSCDGRAGGTGDARSADHERILEGTGCNRGCAARGWYWSGDIVTRDSEGFYRVVDRRKEMIKYKGFPVAPAEVEAVLLEHPAVRECGVVGRADAEAGRDSGGVFALRDGFATGQENGRRVVRVCCRTADAL